MPLAAAQQAESRMRVLPPLLIKDATGISTIAGGRDRWVFLKLITSEPGLNGIGTGNNAYQTRTAITALEKRLIRWLIGKDANRIAPTTGLTGAPVINEQLAAKYPLAEARQNGHYRTDRALDGYIVRLRMFVRECSSGNEIQLTQLAHDDTWYRRNRMNRNTGNESTRMIALTLGLCAITLLLPGTSQAQLFSNFSKQELIDYTVQNPFERMPDGRPKVPDAMIERAKEMSSEEVWAVLPGKGYRNQYADGFHVLHPGKTMVGRAFTVQFMPARPDVDQVAEGKAKANGIPRLKNQTAIDMLQPGDVLVVDLFGKKVNGTIVGDNLFYYVMKATHSGGLVVDGSIRDLDGIAKMDMAAYFRHADPTPIGEVMLTGVNIPVRIGGVTVMPGDLVFGDREGIYFIPPQEVKGVLDRADEIHIHDEWTRKKFDEGKYKSSEIYGSPTDPALKKEYAEFLKRRLSEVEKSREK